MTSAEPYPLEKVAEAVRAEYDGDALAVDDLLDAFELPINDERRLRAALYELYLRGELLRDSDVSDSGRNDAYHLSEEYSG